MSAEMSRPKKRASRIAPGGEHDVAAGAAAELEHRAARRHVQPGEHPVAAEQVVFAGQVVDVALTAIDAVHQRGVAVGMVDRAHQPIFT